MQNPYASKKGGGNSATQAENANNTATNNNVNDNIMGTNNDGSNILADQSAMRYSTTTSPTFSLSKESMILNWNLSAMIWKDI